MGWTSYYTNKSNKECCLEQVTHYKGTVKKTAMKGNTFYALIKSPEGEDWILALLTSRKDGQFFYKDIQCNPYETSYDYPISILQAFEPANMEDLIFLSECINRMNSYKNIMSERKCGSIWKLELKYELLYSDGKKIEKGSELYVMINPLNPYKKKSRKTFFICEKDDNGNFRQTRYRIRDYVFNGSNPVKIK